MTALRPFNQIMSELLEQSGLTQYELSEKLADMPSCPLAKEQTRSPGIDLINAMVEILEPSLPQEMELFRSVSALMGMDPEKEFFEMFCAYRKGAGLSLEAIGAKLEGSLTEQQDGMGYDIVAALYETGAKTPNHDEAQILISMFGLEDEIEIDNFMVKVTSSNKPVLQVVDDNFSGHKPLSDEQIENAEKCLQEDTLAKTELIIGEAEKILIANKIRKLPESEDS